MSIHERKVLELSLCSYAVPSVNAERAHSSPTTPASQTWNSSKSNTVTQGQTLGQARRPLLSPSPIHCMKTRLREEEL
ncbi:hypothetical protein BJV77DRAFT_1022356 [Russula vinacea]|nr:hypothetical protein BJV77DRAFT_1022356 [Russula vinacea]